MDSAYKAVNLLLNNEDSVNATLREVEQLNDERKHLTKIFTEDALQKVRREDNLLFYVSRDIKHGII
jgi:single-stranded DNA-specific DHH superfamily exonuclease